MLRSRQLLNAIATVLLAAQLQHATGSFFPWNLFKSTTVKSIQSRLQPIQQLAAGSPSAVLKTYPSLQNGESLQSLQPAVHGRVAKAGMAERLNWSQEPKYAVAREAVFNDWRLQELENPLPALQPGQPVTCAAARHTPVPHHHCHVFVNHEYRIAYIRSPKSSSTSIMNWLGQCNYNKTRNWNSTTCMQYSWEKFHTLEETADLWKDYFVFGFVRNPWNRAYSLYKDVVGTNHFIHKHGPMCSLEWGEFCKNPFGEFDRLLDSGCGHVEPHYAYWHMMDQYHCMVTPTGEWAVDFLGRVEHGDEDWQVVVEEMNKRRQPGVPELQFSSYGHVHQVLPGQKPPERKKQHTRPKPSRRSLKYLPFGHAADCTDPNGPYCGKHAHCIDAVSQWYACDVERFGYLPNSVSNQSTRLV